jgi:hypothetical protein
MMPGRAQALVIVAAVALQGYGGLRLGWNVDGGSASNLGLDIGIAREAQASDRTKPPAPPPDDRPPPFP